MPGLEHTTFYLSAGCLALFFFMGGSFYCCCRKKKVSLSDLEAALLEYDSD